MKDPVVQLYDHVDKQQLARTLWGKPKAFYASTSMDCRRLLYYRYSGHRPAPGSAWLSLVAEAGNIGHDSVRRMLADAGVGLSDIEISDGDVQETGGVRRTFPVKNGEGTFLVAVRPDGKIDVPHNDEVISCVLEIKTVDAYSYQWLNKAYKNGGAEAAERWLRDKKPQYFSQINTTLGTLGEKYAYLIIYDRSFGQIGVHEGDKRLGGFVIEFDEELFERTLTKFSQVTKAVAAGEIMEPEYFPGSTECNQCDFFYLCHGAAQRKQQGKEPYVLYPGTEGVSE